MNKKGGVNLNISKSVGKKVAEKAIANGIQQIVFDRNGYLCIGSIAVPTPDGCLTVYAAGRRLAGESGAQ